MVFWRRGTEFFAISQLPEKRFMHIHVKIRIFEWYKQAFFKKNFHFLSRFIKLLKKISNNLRDIKHELIMLQKDKLKISV